MRHGYLLMNGQRVAGLQVRLANRMGERLRGLLGTASLDASDSLLIRPCSSIHTFFMQYPIDAVFIHASGRVLKVCAAVRPWSGALCLSAASVLELAAGAAARLGITPGSELVFAQADPREEYAP